MLILILYINDLLVLYIYIDQKHTEISGENRGIDIQSNRTLSIPSGKLT
jgi:hypothetical protein